MPCEKSKKSCLTNSSGGERKKSRRPITKRSTEAADDAGFEIIVFWRRLGYRGRYVAEAMAHIEHLNDHPDDPNRGLYLLDCDTFADILPAVSKLPGKHFVTLLIADFSTMTLDDMVDLSKQLISAGSRYFCAWGRDCQMAHLAFDLACCEFEADSEHVILTTDHSKESLEDSIWFTLVCAYPVDPYDKDWRATIAICVNNNTASHAVRNAFTAPAEFADKNGPVVDEAT